MFQSTGQVAMNETNSAGIDDDRIAMAAKRIIRQYRLQQSDRSEGSVSAIPRSLPRSPDDLQSLRLAIDNMELAIEQIQRVQVNREAVLLEAMERIDRNVAKAAGRIDALAAEVTRIASQPALDIDRMLDEQRMSVGGVIEEFGRMMALGRALLDEAAQIHEAALTSLRAPATIGQSGH